MRPTTYFVSKMEDGPRYRPSLFGGVKLVQPVHTYKYFDTPDGQDCFQKMWYITKWAAGTGATIGFYDVTMYSHPKGYAAVAARFGGFFFGPIVAMGVAYTAGTYMSTNFRKKDDHLNHAVGALVASSVYGLFRNGVTSGFKMSLLLLPLALLYKDSDIRNYEILPQPISGTTDFRGVYRDYSLVPNDKPSYGPRE